jgi:RNA polymerase sigma-70 factor (ECF subfamily)
LLAPGPIRTETVRAYLFTIARNLYLKAWHKERRATILDESIPDRTPGADRTVETRDELRAVLAALQELPEIDRTALLMRARDQTSHREIAAALGLSEAAVKVRIHRARMKLAQLLEEKS